MKIVTNGVPRWTMNWFELSEDDKNEYDHCGEDDTFVRYRGMLFCLGDFIRTDGYGDLSSWDGVIGMSAFHSVLIRLVGDGDRVIMGSAFA